MNGIGVEIHIIIKYFEFKCSCNVIGTIKLPELGANVEFGDRDHKTLYIAARTGIYKIRLNVAGIPAGM